MPPRDCRRPCDNMLEHCGVRLFPLIVDQGLCCGVILISDALWTWERSQAFLDARHSFLPFCLLSVRVEEDSDEDTPAV